MRRVRAACAASVALVLAAARVTRGEPSTTVTLEGGAEADSNVERVESGPGVERTAAPVARLGAKLGHRRALAGGALGIQLSALARVVTAAGAEDESAALAIGELRWLRAIGDRPIRAGIAVSGADASPIGAAIGTRTFRSVGADGLIVLRGGERSALTLAVGGRGFTYKPDRDFDWRGPAANARLDVTLWEPAGGTRSLELAAYAGIEARAYEGTAAANACPDGAMPEDPRSCSAATSLPRHDRYQRIGAELTWAGRVVAGVGYQLAVTDSNSFGQSLLRHRVQLSATTALPGQLYATALAILQVDEFLDGLIVQEDLQNQSFTTLDDENRSSLQLRLARPLGPAWSIEARAAIWRDLDRDPATSFRRAIGYVGIVYRR